MDLTEKLPDTVKFQVNTSDYCDKVICINFSTNVSQDVHLSPVKDLLNSICSGMADKTFATKTFLGRTILNKEGNWADNGILSIQASSQNRVPCPLPTMKDPRPTKSHPTLIIPVQKGESVDSGCTEASVFPRRYLFERNSCHTPSSFSILKRHFLNKHIFLISRTSIPNPPWSFRGQIIRTPFG